jgi:hypothetical protein
MKNYEYLILLNSTSNFVGAIINMMDDWTFQFVFREQAQHLEK